MIYLPKGISNGEVIDPDKTSRDYVEAVKIASDTTQFQWFADEFDIDKFDDSLCKVEYKATIAKLQTTATSIPKLTNNTVNVTDAGGGSAVSLTADSDLFSVPYNRGFVPVDGTDVTWTSQYPELVHFTFSFQWIRALLTTYHVVGANHVSSPGDGALTKVPQIRLQLMIELDGSHIMGSGPFGTNLEGSYRGLGCATSSLATSLNAVQLVPAGVHTVRAVACLLPNTPIENNDLDQKRHLFSSTSRGGSGDPYSYNVNIGNRNMIVCRYGRGKFLGT